MKSTSNPHTYLFRIAQPGDEHQIASIQLKAWRETYQNVVSQEYLASLDKGKRVEVWTELIKYAPARSSLVVIETEGEMIGFASGGIARDMQNKTEGEIYALYLSHTHHGNGLGKELFQGICRLMKGNGFAQAILYILKDNPHRGFYEKMEGQLLREEISEIGGKQYPECVYKWNL